MPIFVIPRWKSFPLLLLLLTGSLAHASGALIPLPTENGCSPSRFLYLSQGLRRQMDMIQKELQGMRHDLDTDWLSQNTTDEAITGLQQRITWHRYLTDKEFRKTQHVYWIQALKLKELNEQILNIGGTERYLIILEEELSAILQENPSYGALIHRNFKDDVLIGKLSAQDFEKKIMDPLRKRVAKRIATLYETKGPSPKWEEYMRETLAFSDGVTVADAHVNLKLLPPYKSFDEWHKAADMARAALQKKTADADIPWNQTLQAMRVYADEPVQMREWLRVRKLAPETADEIKAYNNLLKMGDFLPLDEVPSADEVKEMQAILDLFKVSPVQAITRLNKTPGLLRNSWIFERAHFLSKTTKSHYILATDIKGMGLKALKARDAWLAAGAKLEDLPVVYKQTSRELEESFAEVLNGLRNILGPDAEIEYFRTGDDGLWALPEMTADQLRRVQAYLDGNKSLHDALVKIKKPGNTDSVAEAVAGAREFLFTGIHPDESVPRKNFEILGTPPAPALHN